MSTEFINDQWRLPNNENKDKQSNYSMDFDGANNDHIETSSNVGISGSQSRSMSVWLKGGTSNNNKSWPMAVAFGQGSTNKAMWIGGGGSPSAYWYFGWWGAPSATSGDLATTIRMDADNDWHLLTSTYDGTTAKGYIDGVEVVSAARTINTTDSTLKIGEHLNGSVYWDGQIDGVSIYNYALSSSQVTTLYGSSSTGIGNPMSLSPKPVAYYPLGDQDAFNGANYLVPNSSLKDYVFDFGGSSNEKITTSNSSLINGESAASFSLWIKGKTGLASYDGMLCFRSGSDYILIIARGTITSTEFPVWIQHSGGGVTTSTSNAIVSLNEWNHIVVSGAVGGKWNIYVNGELSTTQSQASNNIAAISQASSFIIGQDISSREFVGEMSNVQIFNTALPATGSNSVETLYNNGSPLTSMTGFTSLQGWWKLDASDTYDGTNWTIEDHAGSNDGTSSGMTQANLVASDLSFKTSISPFALDFDAASGDYIEIYSGTVGNLPPSFSVGASDSQTISCWVKSNTTTNNNFIWLQRGTTTYLRVYLNYHSGTDSYRANIIVRDDSNVSVSESSNANNLVNRNQWNHITTVIDRTNAKLYVYVNKVLTGTGTALGSLGAITQITDVNMGRDSYGGGRYYFNGKLSNCSIWNAALTSAQVSELYNEGVPQNLNNHSAYSNLVSWWQLGSNSSFNTNWTVLDEKGSNNGTSANMGEDAITDGVNSYANGLSSGMGGDEVIGDAPYSTANSLSVNMDVEDRVTDTPS